MSLIGRIGALVLLALGTTAPAAAETCDITLSLVDFGAIENRSGEVVAGEVRVVCDRATRFEVALSSGLGSFRMRTMRGPGGETLRYNLFLDPARRLVWGDGATAGTGTLKGRTRGRRALSIPIYGWVPPGQDAAPGPYTDALVVSLRK